MYSHPTSSYIPDTSFIDHHASFLPDTAEWEPSNCIIEIAREQLPINPDWKNL